MPGSVFVTVGTTKFDALIAAVDTNAVAEALLAKGFTELIMQVCDISISIHRLLSKRGIRPSRCVWRVCCFSSVSHLHPPCWQVGKGSYTPKVLCPAGSTTHTLPGGLRVQWFEYAPSLKVW